MNETEKTLLEGLEAIRHADPNNFKHSEVRKIKRALLLAMKRLEVVEGFHERTTREEL